MKVETLKYELDSQLLFISTYHAIRRTLERAR